MAHGPWGMRYNIMLCLLCCTPGEERVRAHVPIGLPCTARPCTTPPLAAGHLQRGPGSVVLLHGPAGGPERHRHWHTGCVRGRRILQALLQTMPVWDVWVRLVARMSPHCTACVAMPPGAGIHAPAPCDPAALRWLRGLAPKHVHASAHLAGPHMHRGAAANELLRLTTARASPPSNPWH